MPVLGFRRLSDPGRGDGTGSHRGARSRIPVSRTARSYINEEAVGRAIASSGVPRDELFITTKLWVEDQGEEKAKRAFDASLARLGLDYLDLLIIHQPFGDYYAPGARWRNYIARDSRAQ